MAAEFLDLAPAGTLIYFVNKLSLYVFLHSNLSIHLFLFGVVLFVVLTGHLKIVAKSNGVLALQESLASSLVVQNCSSSPEIVNM